MHQSTAVSGGSESCADARKTAAQSATTGASPARLLRPAARFNFPDVLFLFVVGISRSAPLTVISVCYRIRALCPTLERINVDLEDGEL